MNFSRPFLTITPTVDGDVLEALALADAWFTAGRLSAVIESRSLDGVRRALNRLADQGIVEVERAGPAILYRLNRKHLAAPAVTALANMRSDFVTRLRSKVEEWAVKPVYAALFGSATGRLMASDSDVDIFLVKPQGPSTDEWIHQTLRLQLDAERMTGNAVQLLVIGEDELASGFPSPSVVDDVLDVGITVWGDRDWVVRRRHAA